MQFEDFSFARPTGDGWYMTNAPADFTYAEFKKRTESSEAMIRVVQMSPSDIIENEEQLLTYANNLPGEDPIIRLEAGHGATCVRYRGRSALTVNYEENTAGQYQNRMVTDEDSLECIDPDRPGSLFAFTYSERSKAGGSEQGLLEADEFIKSIQFISATQSSASGPSGGR